MNENAGQFRSAALGGFHRQDVLDYVEKLNQTHQEEKAALVQPLEQEIAALKARLSAREEELFQARQVMDALREQIARLEPDAASWHRIKDTAGDIEVAAHERAQITIQEAEGKAAEIHAAGLRVVLDIQARCDKLQQDLHAAVQAAERELTFAKAAFTQAEKDMEGYQQSLSTLVAESGVETP